MNCVFYIEGVWEGNAYSLFIGKHFSKSVCWSIFPVYYGSNGGIFLVNSYGPLITGGV